MAQLILNFLIAVTEIPNKGNSAKRGYGLSTVLQGSREATVSISLVFPFIQSGILASGDDTLHSKDASSLLN